MHFFDYQVPNEFGDFKISGHEIGALNVLQMLDHIADHLGKFDFTEKQRTRKTNCKIKVYSV